MILYTKYFQPRVTTKRPLFSYSSNPTNSHINSIESNEKSSILKSSKTKKPIKVSSHEMKSKTKKKKQKGTGGKKKRRRKPALKNSPITYIKLPAQPYSFVKSEDSTSSYYTPKKSSSSSQFGGNPFQALFQGIFSGETDKSGRLMVSF